MVKRGWWHEAAREAHSRGATQKDIAQLYGVSPVAVWKVIHPEKNRELQRRDYAKYRTARRAYQKAYYERKKENASA